MDSSSYSVYRKQRSRLESIKIIEKQVQANVDGIVVAGTTGESPTLSIQEKNYHLQKKLWLSLKRNVVSCLEQVLIIQSKALNSQN